MKYTIELFENLMNNKVSHNFIFTLDRCEPCSVVKHELEKRQIKVEYVPFEQNAELGKAFGVHTCPTLIMIKDGGYKYYKGDVAVLEKLIKNAPDSEYEKVE